MSVSEIELFGGFFTRISNFQLPTNIKLAKHVAIIMDGNGRWARQQGEERTFGHRNAVSAVRAATEGCAELGIKFLTLYAFSTENWARPKEEIDALMELM